MKTAKKILFIFIIGIFIFISYIVYNSVSFDSKQMDFKLIEPIAIKKDSLENFSNAIKIKTISPENLKDFDPGEFYRFSSFLAQAYPLIDSLLEKKVFNEFSFLYKWQGTDPELKPIILMAHYDVALAKINHPEDEYCNESITPEITIQNLSFVDLLNCSISYEINGETYESD